MLSILGGWAANTEIIPEDSIEPLFAVWRPTVNWQENADGCSIKLSILSNCEPSFSVIHAR
jgi:hypothetical protein